jgi:hypothetical protein
VTEVFLPAEDLDINTKKVYGNIPAAQIGKPDGVFLRGDDGIGAQLPAFVYDVNYLLLAIPVMILKSVPFDYHGSSSLKLAFETGGHGNT